MILFADFEPGAEMGSLTETVSEQQLAEWALLYPWDTPTDSIPLGLATVLMMRAYLHVVSPRPPGNLHVRQQMRLHTPIHAGEAIVTTIACQAKEMRGERRKLELLAKGRAADGRAVFDGTLTLYWAA